MATASFSPDLSAGRRIPLAEIDVAVAARLGPTRGLGNSQPACFNRQVAMYLARHVGRWSTKIIGRFYGGRDHSTVVYSIQRIEAMRETDSDLDVLLTDLRAQLQDGRKPTLVTADRSPRSAPFSKSQLEQIADLVAERIISRLLERPTSIRQGNCSSSGPSKPRLTSIRRPFDNTTDNLCSTATADSFAATSTDTHRLFAGALSSARHRKYRPSVVIPIPRCVQKTCRLSPLASYSVNSFAASARLNRGARSVFLLSLIPRLQQVLRLSDRCVAHTLTTNSRSEHGRRT